MASSAIMRKKSVRSGRADSPFNLSSMPAKPLLIIHNTHHITSIEVSI